MENRFDLIWFIVLNATINGQKKKDKRTNNDLQSTTQIIKDWAARTPLKTGMNSGAPEGWAVPAPMWHPSCYSCYKLVISHAWWKERIVIIKKHEHIVVICDTGTPQRLTKSWTVKLCAQSDDVNLTTKMPIQFHMCHLRITLVW
jgi:hypothetical protein